MSKHLVVWFIVILVMLIIYEVCKFFHHYLTAKKALAICHKKELDFIRQVGRRIVHVARNEQIDLGRIETYCGRSFESAGIYSSATFGHPIHFCLDCSYQLIRLYQLVNEP